MAALGLSGCSSGPQPAAGPEPGPSISTTAAPAPPPEAPLPAPDALTGVLYRLADVGVAGADKVGLVEEATPSDAAALDKFGRALADNGFTPLNFEATELAWSPTEPENVVATIKVTTAAGDQAFSFPMEFTPNAGDWQLTRHTADMLLEMGAAGGPAPPPTPTP